MEQSSWSQRLIITLAAHWDWHDDMTYKKCWKGRRQDIGIILLIDLLT